MSSWDHWFIASNGMAWSALLNSMRAFKVGFGSQSVLGLISRIGSVRTVSQPMDEQFVIVRVFF